MPYITCTIEPYQFLLVKEGIHAENYPQSRNAFTGIRMTLCTYYQHYLPYMSNTHRLTHYTVTHLISPVWYHFVPSLSVLGQTGTGTDKPAVTEHAHREFTSMQLSYHQLRVTAYFLNVSIRQQVKDWSTYRGTATTANNTKGGSQLRTC